MDPAGADALDTLETLVARQREALLRGDPDAAASAGQALLEGAEILRSLGAADAAAQPRLLRLRDALRLNAELLQRAQGLNARALAVLFGSEAFYGTRGEAPIARISRPLDAA